MRDDEATLPDGRRTIWPIGFARTPFADKASAPRQPAAARDVRGRIELVSGRGLEHALDGLEAFDHVWAVFGFHLTGGHWRPKVQPPRSDKKRGVLATRSPHRPNGLGLSVVRLERVEGLVLHVVDVDLVDGSPIYDLKPYLPYTDAIASASSGWLEEPRDPGLRAEIAWAPLASEQRAFVLAESGVDVGLAAETILAAGHEPHPYRRIRALEGSRFRLASKAWRFVFAVSECERADSTERKESVRIRLTIEAMETGYRRTELAKLVGPEGSLHRAFVERFEGRANEERTP
jgi:tRNA-Thr(GGU) m(6)t(6)A37 methyltransferase TsaA